MNPIFYNDEVKAFKKNINMIQSILLNVYSTWYHFVIDSLVCILFFTEPCN